jgi:hypothetical protein
MLALTLIRAWCWAIIFGHKPVENRSWPPPDSLLGARIAIHSGNKYSDAAAGAIDGLTELGAAPAEDEWPGGRIVGTVRIDGWVKHDGNGRMLAWRGVPPEVARTALMSPWVSCEPGYAWLLADPKPLRTPVACSGKQKLWRVSAEDEALVNEQQARAA